MRKFLYYTVLSYSEPSKRKLHENFDVISLEDPSCDTEEVLSEVEAIVYPLGFFCSRDKIDSMKNVRVIGSNTTSHAHIDESYTQERGIHVISLKPYREFLESITPTSELTWGLILVLTRHIIPAYQSVLEKRWDRRPFGADRMLSQSSLGVIGYGRIGRKVASVGRAFGMAVAYYDPYVEQADPDIERCDSVFDLVRQSDIISLHVHHNPETERLISHKVFECCKQGAYFVNTSRGELVDHRALLEALKSGHIKGAALDVLEQDTLPAFSARLTDHPLWVYAHHHHNLILTPHIAGSTKDAWQMTENFVIDRILDMLESED